MANSYVIYADSDQGFADRLKSALGKHEFIPDTHPDPIAAANRVILIASPASLSQPECVRALKAALARDWRRVIHINWERFKRDELKQRIDPSVWQMSVDEALNYIDEVRNTLNVIQWVNFEAYRQSPNEISFGSGFRDLNRALRQADPPHIAFISYSGKQRPLVATLVKTLERLRQPAWAEAPDGSDLNLWFDRDDIQPGRPWLDEINLGVENAHHLVCLVTREWLASWGSNTELLYALELKKRVIAVYLEDFPPIDETLDLARKNGDWQANGQDDNSIDKNIRLAYSALTDAENEEILRRTVCDAKVMQIAAIVRPVVTGKEEVWDDATQVALQPYADLLADVLRRMLCLDAPLDDDLRYVRQHTDYYMEARQWHERGAKEDDLPADAYKRLNILIKAGKNRHPQPNKLHKTYFAAAQQVRGRSRRNLIGIVAAAVLLVGLLAGFALIRQEDGRQRSEADLRATSQAELYVEAQTRIQTLAQLNRRRLYTPVENIRATRPVLLNDSLWISDQANGLVMRLSLATRTLIGEPVAVGSEPYAPVLDGTDAWVSAGSTVTRINIDGTTQTFYVGNSAQSPVITDDAVFVFTAPGRTLYRIDKASSIVTNQSLNDPNALPPVVGGGFVWVLLPADQQLLRFGVDVTQPSVLPLSARPTGALFAGDALYVSVGMELLRINAQTGQTMGRYSANTPLDPPMMAEDSLWLIARQDRTIHQIDPATMGLMSQVSVNAEPHLLYVTANRLWVATRGGEILSFDRNNGLLVTRTPLTGANQLEAIIDDGENLWLTVTQESSVYVIRQQNGEIARELTPCQQPTAPVFDGADMWFACRGEARLVAIPAAPYFFETSNFVQDDRTHTPFVAGGLLWMVQEDMGRVVAFDGQKEAAAYDLAPQLVPLVQSRDYLYTAYPVVGQTSGNLVQIAPALAGSPNAVRTQTLDGALINIEPIESNLWVTYNDMANSDTELNMSVLRQDTLEQVNSVRVGQIPMGVERVGSDIWVGGATMSDAFIYRFNLDGEQVGEPYDIPGTSFGAWSPVVARNRAWFTAAAPTPTDITTMMFDQQTPTFLIPMDLTTYTWGEAITLPDLVSVPEWDGQHMWFSIVGFVITAREELMNGLGVIAVDIDDGTIYGPWQACESLTDFHIIGNYVYVGCLEERLMMVIDRLDLAEPPRVYTQVGINPNPPVTHEGRVWFTFSESDNAAVFDEATGDFVRVFSVGSSPQAPVVYQDRVWVFNSGDGSLQRLHLPSS